MNEVMSKQLKRLYTDPTVIYNKLEELEIYLKKRKAQSIKYNNLVRQSFYNQDHKDQRNSNYENEDITSMIAKKADHSSKLGHFMKNIKLNQVKTLIKKQDPNESFQIKENLDQSDITPLQLQKPKVSFVVKQNDQNNLLLTQQQSQKSQQDEQSQIILQTTESQLTQNNLTLPENGLKKRISNLQVNGESARDGRKSHRSVMASPTQKQKPIQKFESQILPYTVHCDEVTLPPNYHISVQKDMIKKTAKAYKQSIQIEKEIKYFIIGQIYSQIRKKYRYLKEQRKQEFDKFVQNNLAQINQQRAKYLLITPVDTLKSIHKREELQDQFDQDHLPFIELKNKIARSLPNAPRPPKFKIYFEENDFKYYLKFYSSKLQDQLKRMEQQGLFQTLYKSTKPNQTESSKKNKKQVIKSSAHTTPSIKIEQKD